MSEGQSTDHTTEAGETPSAEVRSDGEAKAAPEAATDKGPGVVAAKRPRKKKKTRAGKAGQGAGDAAGAGAEAGGAGESTNSDKPAKPSAREVIEQEIAERDGPAYRVELPAFEGPLDLLLHLIQKHELDILEIPIAFITEKYLAYLKLMEDLSIDIAADYLVMAATLAHIKSKMLLPPSPDEEEEGAEEQEEDPRSELIRRLLEYQKYKGAAEDLANRAVTGRDVFPRGIALEQTTDPAPLAQVSLFKLMDAFQRVLDRVSQNEEHQIDFERITITERISELTDLLRARGRMSFHQLFEGDRNRAELIVTFLAVLEMTRLRLTNVAQAGPFEDIQIELAVRDDADDGDAGASDDDADDNAFETAADGEPREPSDSDGAESSPATAQPGASPDAISDLLSELSTSQAEGLDELEAAEAQRAAVATDGEVGDADASSADVSSADVGDADASSADVSGSDAHESSDASESVEEAAVQVESEPSDVEALDAAPFRDTDESVEVERAPAELDGEHGSEPPRANTDQSMPDEGIPDEGQEAALSVSDSLEEDDLAARPPVSSADPTDTDE